MFLLVTVNFHSYNGELVNPMTIRISKPLARVEEKVCNFAKVSRQSTERVADFYLAIQKSLDAQIPELAEFRLLTCAKSGATVTEIPDNQLSLLVEVHGIAKASALLERRARSTVHPAWLDTSPASLRRLSRIDPFGYFTFRAGNLANAGRQWRASVRSGLESCNPNIQLVAEANELLRRVAELASAKNIAATFPTAILKTVDNPSASNRTALGNIELRAFIAGLRMAIRAIALEFVRRKKREKIESLRALEIVALRRMLGGNQSAHLERSAIKDAVFQLEVVAAELDEVFAECDEELTEPSDAELKLTELQEIETAIEERRLRKAQAAQDKARSQRGYKVATAAPTTGGLKITPRASTGIANLLKQ